MSSVFMPDSGVFTWVILPLLIFSARVVDVSFGTLRIIFLSRGNKVIAPVLGFFEILIWLLAIGQIFRNLNNFLCYIAYAGGFATGNYVGIMIENKMALGMQVVRVITNRNADKLIEMLRSNGFGLTCVDGHGALGPVKVLFTLIRRRDLPRIISLIHEYNPKAFFSVEDVRMAEAGVFPMSPYQQRALWDWLRMRRKGK